MRYSNLHFSLLRIGEESPVQVFAERLSDEFITVFPVALSVVQAR